ncbi:helix-turn-helix domain-containing protein [Streptomyces sp. NPDC060006]|uniref:helix-turn-helix domain-containing protein n=1 Tax=unclassified Streptomyces TaxID=2593676 RepID=UPI0036AD14B0
MGVQFRESVDKRRQFREQIRFEAGERFEQGERNAAIEKDLRVSERSVERWRRAWREGGRAALKSAGAPNRLRGQHWYGFQIAYGPSKLISAEQPSG